MPDREKLEQKPKAKMERTNWERQAKLREETRSAIQRLDEAVRLLQSALRRHSIPQ